MNNRIKEDPIFVENTNRQICMWRLNIHRFCAEYMGLELAMFQKILIYLMDAPFCKEITSFIFFASRGLGKSFLTMVFCLAKSILFPGIQIVVASSVKDQALSLIKKAEEIREGHPNIALEIGYIRVNKESGVIFLKNGSTISAVVCGDNARGRRSNILILDESRLMDKKMIIDVLEPFLTLSNRNQPWAMKEEFKQYAKDEHNSKIFLTSIGYKDEWSYHDFELYLKFISEGMDNYFTFSLPYQFGIEAGIINESYVESRVREANGDLTSLKSEFDVIPHGEAESAMFKYDEISRSRQLIVPLIPPTDFEYVSCKGNIGLIETYQPKEYNEIRIVSMDIAISAGRQNDNTVFTVFRAMNKGDYYDKEVSYIEVMNGVNLDPQILRLKQLFYDLECDYAVIDACGAIGIQAAATCGQVTRDLSRNKTYPGWRTCDKVTKFDIRVADVNAVPVLYALQVSGANSSAMYWNMVVAAQVEFERNHIFMLQRQEQVIDDLNDRYKYIKLKTSNDYTERERAKNIIISFLETDELVKECVETQVIKLPSGRFTIDEGSGRKDRVISMLYGLYFISKLEEDLYVQNRIVNVSEYFSSTPSKQSVRPNPFINNFNRLKNNNFGKR